MGVFLLNMPIQPIRFGDEGQAASRAMVERYAALAPALATCADAQAIDSVRSALAALEALDRRFGGAAAIALPEAETLVASLSGGLASLEAAVRRAGEAPSAVQLADLILAVALWAIRHAVPLAVVEPVANVLAERSNAASGAPELAAVFGLMQGVIAHVRARLAADPERSDPQRPWRILHANLAITAIRTEDPQLMAFAFDALDAALPDERSGFYAEALALALGPRIAPAVLEAIEARHRKSAPESKT
jgi:hypothetical protein